MKQNCRNCFYFVRICKLVLPRRISYYYCTLLSAARLSAMNFACMYLSPLPSIHLSRFFVHFEMEHGRKKAFLMRPARYLFLAQVVLRQWHGPMHSLLHQAAVNPTL